MVIQNTALIIRYYKIQDIAMYFNITVLYYLFYTSHKSMLYLPYKFMINSMKMKSNRKNIDP